jgi:ribonuclease VapC
VILDTSVLVAILTGEDDGARLVEALLGADRVRISAGTLLEVSIVLDSRRSPDLRRRLDDLLRLVGTEVVPFDTEQYVIARAAYQDFGRGSGHAAQLNFGDCFAYALSRVRGEAVLYKGNDFDAAGIRSALDDPR